jgi:hypothetical protein
MTPRQPPEVRTKQLSVASVTERLLAVFNAHDVDGFAALVADDYDSTQPAHPTRAFVGRAQVHENWTAVFAGVPDFQAELLVSATADDGVEVGEWRWHGHHVDGSDFEMRGVTVFGVVDDQIAWGRLYMEPVEDDVDIDTMVTETYLRGRDV